MLTRALVWAGLALFVYFLFTRLRTLAMLAGARRALREGAAVRIRTSRIVVESLAIVATLSLWASRAFHRGHLDWRVGGSDSPLHLELSGTWFIVGFTGLVAATAVMLGLIATIAFAGADDLRHSFPRSRVRRPAVLRLAVMNPVLVFLTPRRSPLAWLRTEARAATIGVVTTLGVEAIDHELPAAHGTLSDTVDDTTEALDLEKRWARRGRAVMWNQLPKYLAAGAPAASVEVDPLLLPPDTLKGGRAAGFVFGAVVSERKARRATRRRATLATFDERARLEAILAKTPGPLARVYLTEGVDALLHQVRGTVLDSLKPRLPRRRGRELAKAYRDGYMDGAAAWMISNIASYPELFDHAAHAELDQGASMVDSIVARIHERAGGAGKHGDTQ